VKKRLVNVRLDEERLKKASKLRERGIVLSDLVREAIDARYDALGVADESRDTDRLVARLFERYPDPPGLPRRAYDVHAAREARAAVRRRLRRSAKSVK